ncbi:HipA domain-containing protein [Candidatus Parabeggiatoa sp. HSG14]|uniref:HipA domain-containing protein n=1 Tax=Candidatus Parabeggiatoa sp. HSG14 TaxID=3055593 RepID=UPI0025A78D40|nr:HipA domain-containing protein [Thiotrichales bacterium HSG14]
MQNFLFVYKKDRLVGYLNFDGKQYEFVYDSNYLSQSNAKPISLDMLLTDTVFVSEKIFNVFEQVIPEGIDRKLLEKKANYDISSEHLFEAIKKDLTLKSERLILLKYYFYSMIIAHEDMHTKNLSVLTEDNKIRMSPLYDIATTAVYQGAFHRETALLINGKDKNIRPADFYKLVDLIEANKKRFNKEAAHILFRYTHNLPEYFDKLEKLPDIIFYERSRVNRTGRKPRFTKPISFAERLRRKHQQRIKQLDKAGWYKYFN